jgi:hypothetical protein
VTDWAIGGTPTRRKDLGGPELPPAIDVLSHFQALARARLSCSPARTPMHSASSARRAAEAVFATALPLQKSCAHSFAQTVLDSPSRVDAIRPRPEQMTSSSCSRADRA